MPTMIAVIGSVLVLLVILHDAFEVMLLPRRVKSRLRIVRMFFRFTWLIWSKLAHRISSEDRRHNYLSLYGPLSMVWLLVVWAGGLVAGFGTLYWALDSGRRVPLSWPNQIYFSGVTFFTLGYGDVLPHTGLEKLLAVLEAGTGLGFIAIVIGYLPVLYQLFARREAKVIMLDAQMLQAICQHHKLAIGKDPEISSMTKQTEISEVLSELQEHPPASE
jgi:hypothetical protein